MHEYSLAKIITIEQGAREKHKSGVSNFFTQINFLF